MANPHKGEVGIEAGGVNYIWRLSTGAIAALESHLDRGIFSIVDELSSWSPPVKNGKPIQETPEQVRARTNKIRVGFCRAIFWAGFTDAHPEMTLQGAGDIMEAVGGLTGAMSIISDGIALAFPQSEASGTPRPPNRADRRRAGSGKNSTKDGSRST